MPSRAQRDKDWAEVCARRLARHHLSVPAPDLSTAAAAMCGVHAQIMSAAELSLALRVPGATKTDVQQALADGTLVKTFGPRGTVHLFPRADLPMWLGALSQAERPPRPPAVRLTEAETSTLIGAIGQSLADGPLTIDELDAQVEKRAGAWAAERVMPAFDGWWPRWRIVLGDAAHRGVLAFGPNRGRKVTYARLEGVKPARNGLKLLRDRYLASYGPATAEQFAQWLAITKPSAARLFEDAPPTAEDVGHPPGGLMLLPYFDAYAVGCHPRELVFPGPAQTRALSRGQAGTVAVVLIDGVVEGIWHQKRSGKRVELTVEPFVPLGKRHRGQLDERVARVGEILGATPSLTIGEVTARAHL